MVVGGMVGSELGTGVFVEGLAEGSLDMMSLAIDVGFAVCATGAGDCGLGQVLGQETDQKVVGLELGRVLGGAFSDEKSCRFLLLAISSALAVEFVGIGVRSLPTPSLSPLNWPRSCNKSPFAFACCLCEFQSVLS